MGVFDNNYGAALDPATMGLLSAAFQGLQASGPSRMPTSFGQVLGQSGQAGLHAYAGAVNSNRQNAQTEAMIDLERAKAALATQQAQRFGLLGNIMGGNDAPVGPPAPPLGAPPGVPAPQGAPQSGMGGSVGQGGPSMMSKSDLYMGKAERLMQAGFFEEANKAADFAKKLNPELEFKDGVWYNKQSGAPIRGGAGINPQGLGYKTDVSPGGEISVGALPGAGNLYLGQQRLGEQAKAERDLVTVPATSPGAPPTLRSRESIVQGGAVPAGLSPAATSQQAADAAQQKDIAENYGKVYSQWQNASMQNPAKMAKLQRIGDLLKDFEGGKLSKSALDIASAANSLGVKIDPKLSNKQAAEALSGEIALELRSTANGNGMPGAMSDADREFLKGMTPNLGLTAEGRKQIIASKVKVMERENQVAKMAREYRQKYGKVDEDFFSQLSGWSDRNPIFK